jgi:hypothetical protein
MIRADTERRAETEALYPARAHPGKAVVVDHLFRAVGVQLHSCPTPNQQHKNAAPIIATTKSPKGKKRWWDTLPHCPCFLSSCWVATSLMPRVLPVTSMGHSPSSGSTCRCPAMLVVFGQECLSRSEILLGHLPVPSGVRYEHGPCGFSSVVHHTRATLMQNRLLCPGQRRAGGDTDDR